MCFLGLIGSLGGGEIILILLVVVLLFGGRKIPELAKGLGEGIKNFRSSVREADDEPNDKNQDKSSGDLEK